MNGNIIEDVGDFPIPVDAYSYDCSGLTVTPGFIDAHSHSDLQVLEKRTEKSRQGVTAEVVGNCGFSPYPGSPDPAALRSFANGILCGDGTWGGSSTADYLKLIALSPTATVGSLAGHGSLRSLFQAIAWALCGQRCRAYGSFVGRSVVRGGDRHRVYPG